ncbi:MAG: hypothetical protein ACK5MV_00120 [Aminipila sp.]
MARPKSANPKTYVGYKINMEESVYNATMRRAKECGRSFNTQVEYACKLDCGISWSYPTIVIGDIGELLLLPIGTYLELDGKTFRRFCRRYLPPYAINRWDTEFKSLGQAVSSCGEIVAVMSPGGIVVHNFELWDKLYQKYK